MPNYGLPGVAMSRNGSRVVGALAVVAATVAGFAWQLQGDEQPDRMQLQLRTERIGEGVIPGTRVRYDGVLVGAVKEIDSVGQGRQLITLDLDRTQTASLTDALTVDYAPENLFGISAVTLRAATGGAPLREDTVVDLAGKVNDVTMGSLLRAITETSTDVLTPKLSELLTTFNEQIGSYTPLFEAIVALSRVVADTQRYPTPYLLDQYSNFFTGVGDFTSSTFKLVSSIMNIEIFVNDRPRYDAFITMVSGGALPAIGAIGDSARTQLDGYTAALTPLLAAVAATVPAPQQSRAEITELIDRLNRMFTSTPEGPALNVAIMLRGIPGVAIPLLGAPR